MKFGKFMGKIGILGQIAMMFILPVVGGALMSGFSNLVGTAATMTTAGATATVTAGSGLLGGALGNVGIAAGKVLQGAANFIGKGVNVFRNVTEGVTNFISNFSKTAANKLSSTLGFEKLPFSDAASNFFGSGDTAWSRSTKSFSNRMSNLTGSKEFIKGLDQAAIDVAKAPAITPAYTPKEGEFVFGSQTTPTAMDEFPEALKSATTPEELQESFLSKPKTATGPLQQDPIFSTEAIPDGTVSKVMEDASDTSWWDEAVTKTKAAGKDEFTNFGSNTVKRLANAPVAGLEAGLMQEGMEFVVGEPEQPDQFVSRGGTNLGMASVGSGDSGGSINPNAYGNVDYGINMGAMPYGYNAIQAGYKSFLNTSLSRTG